MCFETLYSAEEDDNEYDEDDDKVIGRYKSEGLGPDWWEKDMKVIPVNFGKEHTAMLGHCKMIMEMCCYPCLYWPVAFRSYHVGSWRQLLLR